MQMLSGTYLSLESGSLVSVHALLGPAVPRTYNESENLVGLTVALNTHVFHDVKWSLDAEDTVMQVNISNADPVLIDARDRYNRLTFAAMDANSRLWTGSRGFTTAESQLPLLGSRSL